ncbi:MAG: redoxin domain-containing protein [Bacteroidales bacterium]|nr:redoxin domain-containing protein [Bacteroidales bacterium]
MEERSMSLINDDSIRDKVKKIISVILQFLVFIIFVWGITKWQSRHLITPKKTVPKMILSGLDGKKYVFPESRKTVLYFFAPWCSVCRFSSHNIVAYRKSVANQKVAVYAIGLGWRRKDELRKFALKHKLSMPVLVGDEKVQTMYRIKSFPTIYILKNGVVADRVVGYTTELGLRLRAY